MNVLNIHGKRDYLRVDDEGNLLISGGTGGGSSSLPSNPSVPQIITVIKEVPVEKRVEVVKEVIKTVEVEKQVEVVHEVIKEIPVVHRVEVVKEVIKEVPVEKRVEVVKELSIEEMEALVDAHRTRLDFLDPLIAQLGSRLPAVFKAGMKSAQVAELVNFAKENGQDVWYCDYDGQYPVKWIDHGQKSESFVRASRYSGNGRDYPSFRLGKPGNGVRHYFAYVATTPFKSMTAYLEKVGRNTHLPVWWLEPPNPTSANTHSSVNQSWDHYLMTIDPMWDPASTTQTSQTWTGPVSLRPIFGTDAMIFCRGNPVE